MLVSAVLPVADWRACSQMAREAEEAGYDSVQANELRHDPFAPLAFAAMATVRIQLATSVAIAFPRSPMALANQAWDLHRHSGGRFVLGLGSQVKAHIERRFSATWDAPAARMREYVQALRSIFRCWEHGETLNYRGRYYSFTLMTPEFTPPEAGLPLPPVEIAAVGEGMLRTAARVADGVRLHGFATREYLQQVVRPILTEELEKSGKSFEHFHVSGGGFVATGADGRAVADATERIRSRVAFYGSTPAYRGVLDLHGLGDLGAPLHMLSREGRWAEMPSLISDDTLRLFCASAPYERLAAAIEQRFGGLVDSVVLELSSACPTSLQRHVIEQIHRISHEFRSYKRQ